ncbi:MAG: twin-arginine translocation signal domain-containing protein, partial [Thermomicrobiales bacterium]|nr:twin-arginine translocation signal domain-containing protein [Thermomicrobiales bacterium]
MSPKDTDRSYLHDPRFLHHHGLSRRQFMKFGAAGTGVLLAGGVPRALPSVAAQNEIV